MRASSGILLVLRLYFHWDSIYLKCLFTMDLYMSWACLLSAHWHGSIKPILQGPSDFISILFYCPLHPFWSVVIEKEGQMGWRLKNYRLTVQCSWVDGSNEWVNDWKRRRCQVYKHLTSCPKAFMVHDTCRSLIGFYLGSKRRFVFHALFL